jgi:predicted dehydrogenase
LRSGWGLTEKWAGWQEPPEWGGFGHVVMNVIGSEGIINLNFQPMNLYAVDSKEGWKFPETRHWPTVNGKLAGAERMEIQHFLECVLFDLPPLIDGKAGRRSLEIGVAAEKSIEEKREIELPL